MIALVALALLLASILCLIRRRRRRQNPRSPPGPTGLPIIGNLHQLAAAAPHLYLHKLSQHYGPLVSINLGSVPAIVVSSPEIAKQVLKTHDLAFCSRPKLLGQHRLFYNGSEVAFAPYGDSWRELRKLCVLHLLSNKRVQSFGRIREEEVSRMIRNLPSGEACDLSAAMLNFTSTLICRVAFGDESRRRKFDELMIESQVMQGSFFVADYLPWFGWVDRLSGMMARLDRVCRDFDEFLGLLIEEHLDPSRPESKDPNILELLIRLKQEENSFSIPLTWDHVKGILMDIFVGGTDTGAATIIWSMTAMIQNPTIMKKLQKEIRELVGDRGEVKEDDIPKLPYLHAVVKEALRLYPPAPLLLPRESIETRNLYGYAIPAKTRIFINAWAIARDPEYWENPNDFVPERFLNSKVDVMGQDFEVIPFGAGRRGCPGISMGLATVELALANLVYSFDWELPRGMRREDIDTQVFPGLTMHKKIPLCLVPLKKCV